MMSQAEAKSPDALASLGWKRTLSGLVAFKDKCLRETYKIQILSDVKNQFSPKKNMIYFVIRFKFFPRKSLKFKEY